MHPLTSPILIDNYHPSQSTTAIEIALKAISEEGDKVPQKSFEWAAKFIIENYERFTSTNKSKEEQFKKQLLDLRTKLVSPHPKILQNNFTSQLFSRLFVRCCADQIKIYLKYFHGIFSTKIEPTINEEVHLAGRVTDLSIPCYHLVDDETKTLMREVLSLLANITPETLKSKNRMAVYKIAISCFKELDPDKQAPPEYFPPEDPRSDDDLSVSESESFEESQSPLPSSPLLQHSRPIPISKRAPSHARRKSSLEESPDIASPMDTFFSSSKILSEIIAESPGSISPENQQSRIDQFRSINAFGRSFLIHYGPHIVSGVSLALVETLRNPLKNEEFYNLLFSFINPELAKNHVSSFTEQLFLHLREALKKQMPALIKSMTMSVVDTLKDEKLGPKFAVLGLDYLTPLCFKKSNDSPDFKKQLILHILSSIKEFLTDLNSCLVEVYKNDKPQENIKDEETILIHLINRKLKSKGMRIIVPDHQNAAEIRKNIRGEIEDILNLWFDSQSAEKDPKRQLMIFLLNSYLSKMIDRVLSPDTLCILINRLLDTPLTFDNSALKTTSTTAKSPDLLDKKYTKNLSTLLHDLFFEIIKMGETSSILTSIIEFLEPIVKSKMKDAAKEAHKNIDEAVKKEFINDTIIGPIIFLDQFLYDKAKEESSADMFTRKPSLTKFASMTPPEFKEIRQRVDKDIKRRPSEKVRELIDNNLSFPLRMGLKALNIEKFCQNLTERLYRLSQQELLMKILLSYIKKGLIKALT